MKSQITDLIKNLREMVEDSDESEENDRDCYFLARGRREALEEVISMLEKLRETQ